MQQAFLHGCRCRSPPELLVRRTARFDVSRIVLFCTICFATPPGGPPGGPPLPPLLPLPPVPLVGASWSGACLGLRLPQVLVVLAVRVDIVVVI